jgi:hypothetical protein
MKKNPDNLQSEITSDFKNRKKELKTIEGCLKSGKFEFMLTYGRRRVGKTALHLHATRDVKIIYYLARRARNVEKFKGQCVKIIPEAEMIKADYESLFKFVKDKVDAVIIDEFPEMVREDSNILNIFQYIIDIILKDSTLKLFLLGSSISVMKSEVLSSPSPLYGRRTASLHLKPFSFDILKEFFPDSDMKEIIQIYGFSGGIPYYLNHINLPFWKWLNTELKRQFFIRDEAEFLLRYELFNSSRYFSILEAIAYGKNQLNEIAQYSKVPITSLPQYLSKLEEVGFIKRQIPITERITSKKGRYILMDNFLRFYFRFIYPNLESVDRMIMRAKDIQAEYPHYMGKIFKDAISQFLVGYREKINFMELNNRIKSNDYLNFTKIGRWWWKETEIDLLAFNPHTEKALLVECKWQDDINGEAVAAKLFNKKLEIRYRGNHANKEYVLMVFAKSFINKAKYAKTIGNIPVIYLDLQELDEFVSDYRSN